MNKERLKSIKQHLSDASYHIGLCSDEPVANAVDHLHKAVSLLLFEVEKGRGASFLDEALNSGDGTYKP